MAENDQNAQPATPQVIQAPRTSVRPPDLPSEQVNPNHATEHAPAAGGFFSKLISTVTSFLPFLNMFKGGKNAVIDDANETVEKNKISTAVEHGKENLGEAVDKIKDLADNKNIEQAQEKAAGVFKSLKEKLPEGGLGNGVAIAGGTTMAAHGAARTVQGLKKDENGNRNLRQAFTGAVETVIGGAMALAAFQQRQNAAGRGEHATQATASKNSAPQVQGI